MIRLYKNEEPPVLTENAARWLAELTTAIEAANKKQISEKQNKYNHPEIKAALKIETKEKCAYCEAKITDVSYGDIEHVTPKSNDPALTFQWTNLTFACSICNRNKWNKIGILDPYQDEPLEHLFFAGAFVKGRTPLGTRTVRELKLNRVAIIESRNREIERYANEIEKAHLVPDQRIRDLIIESLWDDLRSKEPEFVAACSAAVAAMTAS